MSTTAASPIRWVPTLYFVQGLQFFVVMLIAGLMLKGLGVANDSIGNWTATIGLAWAFKPLWSPFLELWPSKKQIVVATQFLGAMLMAALAVALHLPFWFAATIGVLFVLAYGSATHDIACDGLYMAALDERSQARYVGWQGAFFNASKFLALGGLLKLVGWLEGSFSTQQSWSIIFALLAVAVGALATWNWRSMPEPAPPQGAGTKLTAANIFATQRAVLEQFLRKPGVWLFILFIVLFRFGEGQVQTIGPLFLVEARGTGGLGLSSGQVGDIYGIAGTAAFLVGSILGGYFTAKLQLRRAMPVLIAAMIVPNIVFWWLASTLPTELWQITAAVSVESFFYGFGFVGMILFLMQVVAPGRFQTAHYALGTGVMQLGFIFSKFISGNIQVALGYEKFFLWTVFSGLPVALLIYFIPWPSSTAAPPRQ